MFLFSSTSVNVLLFIFVLSPEGNNYQDNIIIIVSISYHLNYPFFWSSPKIPLLFHRVIVNKSLWRVALAKSNYFYKISEVVLLKFLQFYICTCFTVISSKSKGAVTRVTVDTIFTCSTNFNSWSACVSSGQIGVARSMGCKLYANEVRLLLTFKLLSIFN